jgi:hypothetical protein
MVKASASLWLAFRARSRAKTGLYFIERCLSSRSGGTDSADSRSLYLLLSVNFELLLNCLYIVSRLAGSPDEIVGELKGIKPNHDFKAISDKISSEVLNRAGIKAIKKNHIGGLTNYTILLTSGEEVTLEDLLDVRYDYTKEDLRKVDSQEFDRLKREVKALLALSHKIDSDYFSNVDFSAHIKI